MELIKSSRAAACALLFLLLVLTHGGGGGIVAADARVCTGKSQHHSFPCVSDRLCTRSCVTEGGGWTAGYCRRTICTCQKAC